MSGDAKELSKRLKRLDEYHRQKLGDVVEEDKGKRRRGQKGDERDVHPKKRKKKGDESVVRPKEEWKGRGEEVQGPPPPSVQIIRDPSLRSTRTETSTVLPKTSARNYLSGKVSAVESTRGVGAVNVKRAGSGRTPGNDDDDDDQANKAKDAELQSILARSGLLSGSSGKFEPLRAIQSLIRESKTGKDRHRMNERDLALLSGKAGSTFTKQAHVPQAIAVGMARKRLERRRAEVEAQREQEGPRVRKGRSRMRPLGTKNLKDLLAYEEAEQKREKSQVRGMSLSAPRFKDKRDRGIGQANGKFKNGVLTLKRDAALPRS